MRHFSTRILAFVLMAACSACGQTAIDSGKQTSAHIDHQSRMIASISYLWGYLKYHHPYIYDDCAEWDNELVVVLRDIRGTNGRDSLEHYAAAWIERIEDLDTEPPDSYWVDQSTGIALAKRKPQTQAFGIDMSLIMGIVRRDTVSDPQKCAYLAENSAGNAVFDREENYEEQVPPDDLGRLLALARYWNIIEYWFPYRELMDEDWNHVLLDSIDEFLAADTAAEYKKALVRLIVRIDDTHAWLWTGADVIPPGGWAMSPVVIRPIEGVPLVTKALSTESPADNTGVVPGDIILAVNSQPVDQILDEWRPLYGASNEMSFLREAHQNLLRGSAETIEVTVDRDGSKKDLLVPLVGMREIDRNPIYSHDRDGETYQVLDGDIAYLKLSSLEKANIAGYLDGMAGRRGLIIDIRGYPASFVVFALGQHLVSEPTPFAKLTWPNPNRPGEFLWSQNMVIQPVEPNLKCRVVILVDERSQSQSEYTAMALRAGPNAIIVGSQTAGADGNVSKIVLPGGEQTTISGLGVFYPDGRPTQQVGIQPDVVVRPTIDGMRRGQDEVLDKALLLAAGDAC